MSVSRTTIMASDVLVKRVASHVDKNRESLTDFYNRALLNQLEKEGDFDIRDLVEKEQQDDKK